MVQVWGVGLAELEFYPKGSGETVMESGMIRSAFYKDCSTERRLGGAVRGSWLSSR